MIRLASTDRVLVRMPSWLGDFVMAEPFVRALAATRRPSDPRLTIVAPGPFLGLLDGRFPGVERLPTGASGTRAPHPDWRGHDVAIFLDGSLRSVWNAFRARIPVRVGWARGARGWLLTDAVHPARERGGAPFGLGRPGRWPRYLPRPFGSVCHELAAAMGVPVFDLAPRLEPTAGATQAAESRLAQLGCEPGSFALFNVGARPGSAKGYAPEAWARAIAAVMDEVRLPVLVVCGPGEEERVHAVLASGVAASSAGAPGSAAIHGLADPPPDLGELAALCRAARVVVTADGGARHVAGAVGTPRVVVFGPTDPRHTAEEWADETQLRVQVDCGPCHLERCPLSGDAHGRCMDGVRPASIAAATLERIG